MYRSILVPLDGSALSEQALPIAQSIARRNGAHVTLAYVRTPVEMHAATDAWTDTHNETIESDQSIARLYLQKLAQRLSSDKQLSVTSRVLVGEVVETLCEYVANRNIDLIVMTTHGRGLLSRLWLGSVADALMRHVSIPVLLVRAHEPEESLPGEPVFEHILIPLDGSALAESALEPAIALGRLHGSRFTLLQVIQPAPFLYASPPLASAIEKDFLAEQSAAAHTYLEGIAERFRPHALSVESVVFFDFPANAITTFAHQSAVNLIAMATHGRGGFKRLMLGSIADKVVRSANMSLLIISPQQEQHVQTADQPARSASSFETSTHEG